MEKTPAKSSARGRWVVIVLILLGCLAGAISVLWWRYVSIQLPAAAPQTQPTDEPQVGARPGDEQLEILRERFTDLLSRKQVLEPLRQDVAAYLEQHPQAADGHNLLAMIELEMGNSSQAFLRFQTSLALDPRQPEVLVNTGTLAQRLGKMEEAQRAYAAAVQVEPGKARYRLYLAQVLLERGQRPEAQAQLQEALRLDSSSHQAYGMLSDVALEQSDYALALDNIQKAIESTPVKERGKQVLYIRKKAVILQKLQKPEQALQVLHNLTQVERTDPDTLEQMAQSWATLGEPQQAAQLYEQAMALKPMSWQLAAGAARWRLTAGDRAAARRHVELLQRLNPRAPDLARLQTQLQ